MYSWRTSSHASCATAFQPLTARPSRFSLVANAASEAAFPLAPVPSGKLCDDFSSVGRELDEAAVKAALHGAEAAEAAEAVVLDTTIVCVMLQSDVGGSIAAVVQAFAVDSVSAVAVECAGGPDNPGTARSTWTVGDDHWCATHPGTCGSQTSSTETTNATTARNNRWSVRVIRLVIAA